MYSYNAFSVYNSDQLTLLDVQIYSTGGMGCYAQNVSGITLDGLVITKAPGRVMSITADGFHCSNCGRNGAVIVRGCTFEGQGVFV